MTSHNAFADVVRSFFVHIVIHVSTSVLQQNEYGIQYFSVILKEKSEKRFSI